jgi:hypothetical protein
MRLGGKGTNMVTYRECLTYIDHPRGRRSRHALRLKGVQDDLLQHGGLVTTDV